MFEDAIAALRHAAEAIPDDVVLRLHLARTELAAGLPDEAITTLAAVLILDPGNQTAKNMMAGALRAPLADHFDWDAAERDYLRTPRPAKPLSPS